jgi:hypothetical protein
MKDITTKTQRTVVTVHLPDRDGLGPSELKCISLMEEAALSVVFSFSHDDGRIESNQRNLLSFLRRVSSCLHDAGVVNVAEALEEVLQRCTADPDFGGYGLDERQTLQPPQEADVVFLCSAFLEALKSASRAQSRPRVLFSERPKGRRGMTMAEKIFAMHDVSRRGHVKPLDIIQVDIDWVLASELSWQVSSICTSSSKRTRFRMTDGYLVSQGHGDSV